MSVLIIQLKIEFWFSFSGLPKVRGQNCVCLKEIKLGSFFIQKCKLEWLFSLSFLSINQFKNKLKVGTNLNIFDGEIIEGILVIVDDILESKQGTIFEENKISSSPIFDMFSSLHKPSLMNGILGSATSIDASSGSGTAGWHSCSHIWVILIGGTRSRSITSWALTGGVFS